MTPPPMTTTCARSGISGTSDLGQEPVELRPAEGRLGLLEPLHAPPVEVEVGGAGGGLDEAPERPAVLAAQRLETDPRQIGRGRRAEVGLGVGVGLLGREVALGRGVAELEAG